MCIVLLGVTLVILQVLLLKVHWVVYLENFPRWSPFYEADPTQIIEVKGKDGQTGVQYHWDGNKGKDLGYQEITVIKPLEYIKMECDIQKPFNRPHPNWIHILFEKRQVRPVIFFDDR